MQHNEQEALSPKKLHQKVIELLSSNADLAEAVSRFVLFCKKIFKLQILAICLTENCFRVQKYLTLFTSALLELHEQSSFV